MVGGGGGVLVGGGGGQCHKPRETVRNIGESPIRVGLPVTLGSPTLDTLDTFSWKCTFSTADE